MTHNPITLKGSPSCSTLWGRIFYTRCRRVLCLLADILDTSKNSSDVQFSKHTSSMMEWSVTGLRPPGHDCLNRLDQKNTSSEPQHRKMQQYSLMGQYNKVELQIWHEEWSNFHQFVHMVEIFHKFSNENTWIIFHLWASKPIFRNCQQRLLR